MLSQETWRFINSFAPWFSAIGTLSAVILSLYLARRDRNIRLEVSANHSLVIPGNGEETSEYLSIYVVNIGHREAQITNIGWKTGIFKKRYAIQTPPVNALSSPIPVRLNDGQEAKYLIPLNTDEDFLTHFTEKMLTPFPLFQREYAKIQVHTSIGKTFEANLAKSLQKKIIENYKKKKIA